MKCKRCDSKATKKVPNYFVVGKDRNYYLCEYHADEWDELHPFSTKAIKL